VETHLLAPEDVGDLAQHIASGPHPKVGQYLSHLSTPEELLTAGQQEFETLSPRLIQRRAKHSRRRPRGEGECWPFTHQDGARCERVGVGEEIVRVSAAAELPGAARAHRVEERIDDLGERGRERMKPAGPCLALQNRSKRSLELAKAGAPPSAATTLKQHQVQRGAQDPS